MLHEIVCTVWACESHGTCFLRHARSNARFHFPPRRLSLLEESLNIHLSPTDLLKNDFLLYAYVYFLAFFFFIDLSVFAQLPHRGSQTPPYALFLVEGAQLGWHQAPLERGEPPPLQAWWPGARPKDCPAAEAQGAGVGSQRRRPRLRLRAQRCPRRRHRVLARAGAPPSCPPAFAQTTPSMPYLKTPTSGTRLFRSPLYSTRHPESGIRSSLNLRRGRFRLRHYLTQHLRLARKGS